MLCICVASALVVLTCISCIYWKCVRWFYIHNCTLTAFFPCRGLGEGVLEPVSACIWAKAGYTSGWVAISSRASLLYWIQQNVEQQHNGETLRSAEQHNCNKDLASWAIWTPPGDLSWCSPLEKPYTQELTNEHVTGSYWLPRKPSKHPVFCAFGHSYNTNCRITSILFWQDYHSRPVQVM